MLFFRNSDYDVTKEVIEHLEYQTGELHTVSEQKSKKYSQHLDWPIWTTDVRQAYLQSASLLNRAVFLNPNGFSLGKDEFLQLMLLYGLSESGDYWSKTFANHCLDDFPLNNLQLTFLSFSRGKGRNWSLFQLLCRRPFADCSS
jgi:hypothetical protein